VTSVDDGDLSGAANALRSGEYGQALETFRHVGALPSATANEREKAVTGEALALIGLRRSREAVELLKSPSAGDHHIRHLALAQAYAVRLRLGPTLNASRQAVDRGAAPREVRQAVASAVTQRFGGLVVVCGLIFLVAGLVLGRLGVAPLIFGAVTWMLQAAVDIVAGRKRPAIALLVGAVVAATLLFAFR